MDAVTHQKPESSLDEARFALDLIGQIIEQFPRRSAGSEQELAAQRLLADELVKLVGRGVSPTYESFRFNRSLYEVLALHFGLGALGTVVSGVAPAVGLVCHLLAAGSYVLDSTRKAYLLRRLVPQIESQNLIVTRPARGRPRERVVLIAHVDAAYTGKMFQPSVIKGTAKNNLSPLAAYLVNPLVMVVGTQLAAAGCEATRMLLGPLGLPLRPLEWALGAFSAAGFALNYDVVRRDEVVPGAADDLSGVAATLLLARRLWDSVDEDVELVFVISGSEEAGTGGAYRLAEARQGLWSRDDTVVLALDTVCGGELRYTVEGEFYPLRLAGWLRDAVERTARTDPRFGALEPYRLPVGASDATPFQARGYDAICLGCVDPQLGTPRNYHLPTDDINNIDPDELMLSVDFAEAVVRAIVDER